jgi:hypothetical protein
VRIPVRIESPVPINVIVEQYDGWRLAMTLNGRGTAEVITRGESHRYELAGQQRIVLGEKPGSG